MRKAQAEEPLDLFGDADEDVCLALPAGAEEGEDVETAMDRALVGTELGLLSQVSLHRCCWAFVTTCHGPCAPVWRDFNLPALSH